MTAGRTTPASGLPAGPGAPKPSRAATCYPVAGPCLIPPGGVPPEGLSILFVARERIVVDCAGFDPTSPEAEERLGRMLSSFGANALADALPASSGTVSGLPALVVRFSSLGRETRASLLPGFRPPEARDGPAALHFRLADVEPEPESFDWTRPALAAGRILLSLLLAVSATVILAGLIRAWMRLS